MTSLEPQHVSSTSLRITRIFKASPEQVWQALTDPKEIAKWYAPGTMTATVHKFDAQPGGSFELDMTGPDGIPHGVYGKFVEVLPHRRLVQTWRWRDFPIDTGESRLTLELREVSGGTEVTLTHEKLATVESVKAHIQGWTGSLDKLGKVLQKVI